MNLGWGRFGLRGWGVVALLAAAACADEPFSRLDSLFLAAATGAPRFEALRDSCQAELLAGGRATLEYLAARRFGGQTPRQQHYVERLFVLASDSGRVAASREVLAAALAREPRAPDSVRALILYVGSALGDSAFRATALRDLDAPSPVVRRMALRSLGQYPHPENAEILRAALARAEGLERHQILWALDRQREPAPLALLLPVLEDPWFYNRQKARDLVLKAVDSSWVALKPFRPRAPDARLRREWRLLALSARGGEAWLRSEAKAMSDEERRFFLEPGIKN